MSFIFNDSYYWFGVISLYSFFNWIYQFIVLSFNDLTRWIAWKVDIISHVFTQCTWYNTSYGSIIHMPAHIHDVYI